MATTSRGSTWGGASTNTSELLVAYINKEIQTLEPDLQYARLGLRRDAPKGYDRILFPQTNQLPLKINTSIEGDASGSVYGAAGSIQGGAAATAPGFPVSSTEGVAAITEGTNPTAIAWGSTAYSSPPYQFGILVTVTDLLVRDSAIEVVDAASRQVKLSLARMIDTVLQTTVNAGSQGVIYSGNRTARSSLAAGDTITQSEMNKAVKYLRSSNAAGLRPFEGGYYVAVIHPQVAGDLMSTTQTGSYVDVGRYTSVDSLRAGKMGDFRGIRYLESAWQNYFNSTVDVFPTTVLGEESFGWGFFQQPRAIITNTPDSNNALNLYTSIGGKVALGVTRFEDSIGTQRIVRVESAISG